MIGQINRNLVTFAVGRQISCPECSRVLDTTDAVLFHAAGRENVRCGRCFDLIIVTTVTEVLDGRKLNAPRASLPVTPNPIHLYDVQVGKRYRMRHTSGDITVRVLRKRTEWVHGRNQSRTLTHFVCENEKTGREILVRSAAKFSSEVQA